MSGDDMQFFHNVLEIVLKIEEKLFSFNKIKTRLNLIEVLLVCIMVWNFFKCPVLFRGGGELGREWYLEGKLQNKHKSFEVRLCLPGLSLHRNQTETHSTQARVCYGPCSSSTSYTSQIIGEILWVGFHPYPRMSNHLQIWNKGSTFMNLTVLRLDVLPSL